MIKNRLLMLLAIGVSVAFASLYGGQIAYALMFMCLLLPLFSLLYLLYVFIRFKARQSLKSPVVIKGKKTTYKFILSNKDFIPYSNIKATFFEDKLQLENKELFKNYCIAPKDAYEVKTDISCPYRGNLNVGVNKIIITDFLKLFKVSYLSKTNLKVRVLPPLIQLKSVSGGLDDIEIEQTTSILKTHDQPDVDMRKYLSGDNKKMIHWKATAKKNELFTRKYQNIYKPNTYIIMDLSDTKVQPSKKIETEDKIIESTLSVLDYYFRKKIPTTVMFSYGNMSRVNVCSQKGFDDFHHLCADFDFKSSKPAWQLLMESDKSAYDNGFFVIVTHSISNELSVACQKMIEIGNRITVILIDFEKKDFSGVRFDKRVDIIVIDEKQKISDALERK